MWVFGATENSKNTLPVSWWSPNLQQKDTIQSYGDTSGSPDQTWCLLPNKINRSSSFTWQNRFSLRKNSWISLFFNRKFLQLKMMVVIPTYISAWLYLQDDASAYLKMSSCGGAVLSAPRSFLLQPPSRRQKQLSRSHADGVHPRSVRSHFYRHLAVRVRMCMLKLLKNNL